MRVSARNEELSEIGKTRRRKGRRGKERLDRARGNPRRKEEGAL